ncbi:MAG: hypothetical protein IBJ11_02985 [Phycisphaerales bacterium]|nr:hypothetical protein [Phycisphaerales bacterium]
MGRIRACAAWVVLAAIVGGCGPRPAADGAGRPAAAPERPALANVHEAAPGLISGGQPEGDAAFAELRRLGIRTIVSVDGARPDLARAHAAGIRYVHLPVGYDGIAPERQREMAAAVRELPGPVYVHCHHGKHRGPAAAASIAVLLGKRAPADAVIWMERAGTSPSYPGLFACVRGLHPASADDLAAASSAAAEAGGWPESARVKGIVGAMVKADAGFWNVDRIRKAGWQVPADHPDLVPAAEAAAIVEGLRATADAPETPGHGERFGAMLREAIARATELEDGVAARLPREVLDARWRGVSASCTACHVEFRDR